MPKAKSPVYSRIDYESALRGRKDLLEVQANLLRSEQHMQTFKELRKRELTHKTKLKTALRKVKEGIREIVKEVPKTAGIEPPRKSHSKKKGKKKTKKKDKDQQIKTNIESELADIQRKLEQMSA